MLACPTNYTQLKFFQPLGLHDQEVPDKYIQFSALNMQENAFFGHFKLS